MTNHLQDMLEKATGKSEIVAEIVRRCQAMDAELTALRAENERLKLENARLKQAEWQAAKDANDNDSWRTDSRGYHNY